MCFVISSFLNVICRKTLKECPSPHPHTHTHPNKNIHFSMLWRLCARLYCFWNMRTKSPRNLKTKQKNPMFPFAVGPHVPAGLTMMTTMTILYTFDFVCLYVCVVLILYGVFILHHMILYICSKSVSMYFCLRT